MTSFFAIRDFPTTVDTGSNCKKIHESCFRSYQLLQAVKELLEADTPATVILMIIADIESAPQRDHNPDDYK